MEIRKHHTYCCGCRHLAKILFFETKQRKTKNKNYNAFKKGLVSCANLETVC